MCVCVCVRVCTIILTCFECYHYHLKSLNYNSLTFVEHFNLYPVLTKRVDMKVQGVPQSQTAANLRHQEEEKKDKN